MEKTIKINNFAENLASLLNVKIGQSFRICGTGLGLWYRIVEVPKVTVQTYDCYNDEWRESVLKLVEFVELVHRNGIVIEDRLRNGDICYIPNFSVAKGYNKYTYNDNDFVCRKLIDAGLLFEKEEDAKAYTMSIIEARRTAIKEKAKKMRNDI